MNNKIKAQVYILQSSKIILKNEEMQNSKKYIQHGRISVFTHSLKVAEYSYRFAKKLGIKCDYKALIKAALLHDFFLYDWHYVSLKKLHGISHPKTAAQNAKKHFDINKKETDIILSHMWPLTITKIPKNREAWIICLIDKYCSVIETFRINIYSNKSQAK